MRNTLGILAVSFAVAGLLIVSGPAAADPRDGRPIVGELRTFAIPPGNTAARDQLHRDGWLEADGRVVDTHSFQSLFRVIGRTWTPATVASDEFAVPNLRGRWRPLLSSANPYGVLGPGDLVTSGVPAQIGLMDGPLDYWIFAGQGATRAH
jgi:hypothetical protein